jgi:nicotinamidase-related amidase
MDTKQLALILIDIQRDFWQPLKALLHLSAFPTNIATLLQVARANGLTIIHTQAWFKPDRSDWMLFYRPQGRGSVPCLAGTDGAQFEDFAAPLPREHIIQKQTFDGFVSADLERIMHEHHSKAALIAGLETSVCVLFTATSAYLRRIVPLVVEDACGDEWARHEATIRMYRDLCFKTATTAQVQRKWDAVLHLAETFVERI